MNIWIVHSPSGWKVFDYDGTFLGFHYFMCDCKGHSIRLSKPWERISERSSTEELSIFKNATNITYEYIENESEESNYY